MSLLDLLRLGLARGSRWRVLAIFAGLAILPSLLATLPLWTFLSVKLDRSPAAAALADGPTVPMVLELLRALSDERAGRTLVLGLVSGVVLTLVVAPVAAGAALAESRAREPMQMRGLLAAAGDLYGRLLRTTLVGVLPLGLAAAASSGLFAAAGSASKQALTEAAGRAPGLWAGAGTVVLLFVAHLTLDAGRAHLAAAPGRRSAFLAWTAGAWMVLRRPVRSGVLGAVGTALGLGGAFVLMAVRGHLPAGPAWAAAAGFALATLATAAVAWGRSVRLAALSELAALDTAERIRRRARAAARRAPRSVPTEPLLEAVPAPEPPHPLDVTAPLVPGPPPEDEPR